MKAPIKSSERLARVDNFINTITGLGDPNRDKRLGSVIDGAMRLQWAELEEFYAGDAIASKLVDLMPNDMTRAWVTYAQNTGSTSGNDMLQKLRRLKTQFTFNWALKLANLHGGSVIIIGADDGQELDMPLDESNIKNIGYLTALDRWQIYPTTRVYRDPLKPKYGEPEYYRLQPARHSQATGVIIHESRLLRFDGIKLPDRISLRNLGWGDSILNRLHNAIRSYHTVHDSAAVIVQDFTQTVYKLAGLNELLSEDNDSEGMNALQIRLQSLDYQRSILRALVIDENEAVTKLSTTINGIEKLLESAQNRLQAESGMPHTKLFGESPGASFGEGGANQDRNWYDAVTAKQESMLRDPLERLIYLILVSKDGPTNGQLPDSWSIEFRSLWQVDEATEAKNRLMQSQTDQIYMQEGVLTPEEVAFSRFAGPGYSKDTVIDVDTRKLLGKYEVQSKPLEEAPDV